MKKPSKRTNIKGHFISILVRYSILAIVAIPNLYLFYLIFAPLTVYPIYFLLNLFFDVALAGRTIYVGGGSIDLIDACIAGSAYYLLLILNLTTPKIIIKKRIKMLALAFGALLLVNLIRIFLMSLIFLSDSSWFEITHRLFWYLGSIVFVVGIWFFEVWFFKIKETPLYSDIRELYRNSTFKK